MFYLTATTHSVSLTTSVTGSLDVTASYVDITTTAFTPLSNTVNITASGSSSIIAAPAASTQRQIKSIIIRNISTTVTCVLSVIKLVSATPYLISSEVTLRPGMTLEFEDVDGWSVQSINGSITIKSKTSNVTPGAIFSNNGTTTPAGTTKLSINSDDEQLQISSAGLITPVPPATNRVKLFSKEIAARLMLAQIGPSGLDTAIQPLLARNKVGFWCPPGNATTVPGVLGFTGYTATGTATLRNAATTNMFTRMRRLGFVSVATAGGLGGARVAIAQITLGDYAVSLPVGGFFKVIRFGTSDAANVTGARMFVGISSSTAAPTNVEPSTLLNSIGVAQLSTSTNLQIVWGGATAQPPIDLGINFPANTLSTDVYELALFSPAGRGGLVYYHVTRLNTGDVATGDLVIVNSMAQLPLSSVLLTYTQAWRCNNATALAVGLDIFSDYIETDQ